MKLAKKKTSMQNQRHKHATLGKRMRCGVLDTLSIGTSTSYQ